MQALEEDKTRAVLSESKASEEKSNIRNQKLQARVKSPEKEKIRTGELQRKINELEEEKKKTETLKEKLQEIEGRESYLFNSSYVLNKLGVRDVLWRSGDPQEDLRDEKILFEEAKKMNIGPDADEYQEIVKKNRFNKEQSDFLLKYMSIFAFINKKMSDLPKENVIEQLIVQYDEDTKYTKVVLASELQSQAKSGTSFEEIYNMYPDMVTFEIAKFEDLGKDVQEKVRKIPGGGIGVIWSEEGYVILKPTSRRLSLNPFVEIQPGAREKIKGYIKEWIRSVKKQTEAEPSEQQ